MPTATADPLADVIRERLVDALQRATALAQTELPARLDALQDILDEARDRTSSWQFARLARGPAHLGSRAGAARSETPASDRTAADAPLDPTERRIHDARAHGALAPRAVYALGATSPPGEFLLIPFGEVRVEQALAGRDFVFTPTHASQAVLWFERLGRKLAIDYEHQSLGAGVRPDGLRPAAGWIGRLETRGDGLWAAEVSWTPRASELIASGEYRYFSPVIYWSDDDAQGLAALGPVALTNNPAMHGVAALATHREAPPQAPPRASGTCATPAPASAPATPAEDAADLEIAVLRARLAAQDAEQFVRRGLELGKIVASNSADWREDFLRDPQRALRRLERAPVLLPPGRVVSAAQAPLAAAPTDSPPRAAASGCEPEDLAAFERAARGGRVLGLTV